jgi:signal transduction histidine kinase
MALDGAGLGTWRHDLRTGRLRLDPRGQQHYGMTSDDVEFGDVVARVHPDDQVRLAQEMAVVLAPNGLERHVTEYRVRDLEERYRLLRVHVRVEFEGTGEQRRPVLGYGTTEDVTDKRQAEQLLAEQAELLRDVGEIAQIGGWHFDTATGEGNWTDETLRIHGITGQPDSAAMGLDRFPGEARVRIEQALHEAITRGTPYDLELPFVSVTGEEKWVRAVCRPVIEGGRVVRLRGTLQDVTGHKRLEERLRQAHKLEAIGQLAGGVAHDFNNLLTVIAGNLEVLDDLVRGKPVEGRLLDEIRSAAERAAALTRQLLAFGRKSVLQTRAIEVDATLARVDLMLRRLLGEDIVIRTVLAAGEARIMADEGQFEQVVLNLAVNARDAMPGGGTLTLSTAVVSGDEPSHPGWVRLTVIDTGVGMTPDVQQHVFEPFFTTKPVGKGTGLGLATVFGIVTQCGGRIDVRSAPGAGTTFVLDFPRTDQRAAATPVRPAPDPGHETVLLVEDDAAVRRIAARSLVRHGYQVIEMPGPAEALASLATMPPIDLLITDVVMPAMSGLALADTLRRERPGLRVLYMSGYVQDALHRQGLGSEETLLQKPFTGRDLVRRVREVLDGR